MQAIKITCQDNYILQGHFFQKQKSNTHYLPVLISPATGIPQNFYTSFAHYLAEQGYDVLSFDFRGINQSLHGKLKDSTASITEWGIFDLPAAIEKLQDLSQSNQINLLGHSAGGQLLGLAHNYQSVSNLIAVAGSTGHVPHLAGKTKILAPFMFNILFPISSLLKGYGATKIINMGENLPKNVAKEWRIFCSNPGYSINAIKNGITDYHGKITCPITAIAATDDEIATERNVSDFLKLYPNAQTNMQLLNPNDFQHEHIGHMQFFRRSHQSLWPFLAQHLL